MTRARRGAAAAAPAAALLLACWLLLEVLPDLTGRSGWLPLTRPPVLEPVRLLALVLLEVVMPVAVAAGLLLLLRRTAGRPDPRAVRVHAAGVLAGAVGSAELLKWLLPAVPPGAGTVALPGHGSFPSGHTATAVALALLLLAVRPPDRTPGRPAATGPAVAWSVAVATTTLVAQWHRPADAVGGALLAAAWHRALFPGLVRPAEGDRRGPGPLHRRLPDRWLLGWWLLAAVPAVLAVAATWWSVPSPVRQVLPHVLVIALLAAIVGAVTRWAAPAPAEPSG